MFLAGSSLTLVQRPRRPAPKVKTGCKTCKNRRVKCGEERPNCIRCIRSGRKCKGYAQSTTDSRYGHFDVLVSKGLSGPQRRVPATRIMADHAHHLEFYHQCAVPALSSTFDKDFWSRTSLQIAQFEPCVRHALIALGHLHRAETGSLKDARSGLIAASKQKTLLFHYNKAVKSLVARISEPSYTPEIGLVSCILFVCIEFLRGDYDTAWAHFNSGLKIISAFRRSRAQASVDASAPKMIEDLLIPMFQRMIATAVIYGVRPEPELFICPSPEDIRDDTFTSMAEVQISCHNIRNKAMMFQSTIGPKFIESGIAGPRGITEEDLQYQTEILDLFRAWFRALENFERKTPLSKEDIITAHSLKACYYCFYIFTACTFPDDQQTSFDQYLDEFKALIEHCEIVLDYVKKASLDSPAASFTFEVNVIPYLYITACRCRCPVTRRKAVSLLERNPPREGLWDAQQHLVVAKRLIELEESELDPVTGWPVGRTRIWSTIINGQMDGAGKFPAYFARGLWGEGRGVPPLPPGLKLSWSPQGKMWREWFIL